MNSEKLPKEFKKKWVDALMSGDYKQGQMFLYDPSNDSFCCLGVACVVSGMSKESIAGLGITNRQEEFPKIPEQLLSQEGYKSTPHVFANLNDAEIPFEVIAGVINEML